MSTVAPPVRKQKPRKSGPGSGAGRPWLVIVKNDDHNTFDGVAFALARTIPGVTFERGIEMANRIHKTGRRSSGPASASGPSSTGSSSSASGSRWRRSRRRAEPVAAVDPWQIQADPEWALAIIVAAVDYAVVVRTLRTARLADADLAALLLRHGPRAHRHRPPLAARAHRAHVAPLGPPAPERDPGRLGAAAPRARPHAGDDGGRGEARVGSGRHGAPGRPRPLARRVVRPARPRGLRLRPRASLGARARAPRLPRLGPRLLVGRHVARPDAPAGSRCSSSSARSSPPRRSPSPSPSRSRSTTSTSTRRSSGGSRRSRISRSARSGWPSSRPPSSSPPARSRSCSGSTRMTPRAGR